MYIQLARSPWRIYLILVAGAFYAQSSVAQQEASSPEVHLERVASYGTTPRDTIERRKYPSNPVASALSGSDGASSVLAANPVQSTVEVNATSGVAAPYRTTQEEILSSAGTWGDFSRYLQLLPGVVWNTDMSNDVMVRGGNPAENLFVVDGIEVPNINHLALEGTTGGFTSMVDTAAIRSVDLKVGAYDASYSSRLSSLVDIHTRDARAGTHPSEVDFGIAGLGGMLVRGLGSNGDMQISVHRSVLNLATSDIGIGGVPIYTNGMAKLEWSHGSRDHFRALSLSGVDSIGITPEPCDSGVTLRAQTQYHGGRSTDGLVWQHTHSPQTLSTITMTYSVQSQEIGQQLLPLATTPGGCLGPRVPIYVEHTRDGTGMLKYGLAMSRGKWTSTAGVTGQLTSFNYVVQQPLGQESPFNPNPTWTDDDSFSRHPMVGQTAAYVELSGSIGSSIDTMAAIREETFALTGEHAFEPRASLALRLNERQTINATYSRSSQTAPPIDILSYSGNQRLRPIAVDQFSLGAVLWRTDGMTLSAQAYHKSYFGEPVSTEYPSLTLANMVDTLGQQFVWLPLKTGGWGRAEGIEFLVRAHAADRLHFLSSLTYSRTRYAGADGILRPGNFDFPFVTNGIVTMRLPWKFQVSARDSYSSGRPYTPFDLELSEQQMRGVYDLQHINAFRGPAYNRLDADANRNFHILHGVLNIHGGVENALDRRNFLGYAWESNCRHFLWFSGCGGGNVNPYGVPETKISQMPRFPSAGLRYSF